MMKRKMFSVLLMLTMVLSVTSISVFADDGDEYVAQIGDVKYKTLDEAVAGAKDGDTVILLADCTSSGMNLSKDLTIQGGYKVSFSNNGINMTNGSELNLDGCNVVMTGVATVPGGQKMAIIIGSNCSFTLKDATMVMDANGVDSPNCIYVAGTSGDTAINLNNSTLDIRNYTGNALSWDGGKYTYSVNLENSKYISDHNRSGIVGTFNVTAVNSTVKVINSKGNGSNGSNYTIKNNSLVEFSGNGSHGLSAGDLTVENSKVIADNNGLNGIVFTGKGTFTNADVTITNTKGSSYWNAGMRLMKEKASATIDSDSVVRISNNEVTGVFLDSKAKLVIKDGADVTINNNKAYQTNCTTKKDLAQCGGGLVVRDGAEATLSKSTKIYNNHALLAGDDIYTEGSGTITIGEVVSGVSLDGTPDTNDCNLSIDGWYDDAQDARWNAHTIDPKDLHANAVEPGTLSNSVALKAAHGILDAEEYTPAQLKFIKKDTKTGKPVAGAEFTLTAEDGTALKAVSDKEGIVLFESVPVNGAEATYALKETKSPEGYKASDKAYTITIKSNGETKLSLIDGEAYNLTVYTAESMVVENKDDLFLEEGDDLVFLNDQVEVDPAKPDSPKTGDSNSLVAWMALMIMAVLASTSIVFKRR